MSTATVHRNKSANGKTSLGIIPRLLNGDHLSLPEFERRYWAAPEDKRYELIEGIVIMSPPISNDHGEAQLTLGSFLKRYAQTTSGVVAGTNVSFRLDGKNEFEPDVFLRIASGKLARSKIGTDRLIDGGPELIAEIAVSSAAYDLHEKKSVYQRCLVPEYFVWQVMDSQIHWFALENGEYVEMKPQSDGAIHSKIFPGLWLDTRALLDGNEAKVSRILEKGLKSAERSAFVKKLAASK
jgi:Uma2 family endonuclease